MATEHERIRELGRIFGGAGDEVRVGIGDDAAVLRASPSDSVLSVDCQVDGVHFRREWMSLEDIGHRALTTAVSDLAAMGARPRAALSAIILPPALSDDDLYAIARGIAQAARVYGCPVVGGNLARGGELSITTTVQGEAGRSTPARSGARPGDVLYVVGELGMSALGRQVLAAGKPELAPASVARFRRPIAHVAEGLEIAALATSAIDVSDGLLQDLGHVARASRVGFELQVDALPTHAELLPCAAVLGLDARALALAGGEDYALLFTAPPQATPRHGTRIGRAVEGSGVTLFDREGRAVAAPEGTGFDHFAR